jgi:hypothetical protein
MSVLKEIESIWEQIKSELKLDLGFIRGDLWYDPLDLHSFENNKLKFTTLSEFNETSLAPQYIPLIKQKFAEYTGYPPGKFRQTHLK